MIMKPAVLTSCLMMICIIFFGQKPGTVWPEGEPGANYNVLKNGKKEGVWIRIYPNKNLYYKGQFKGGVPYGKFEFYYETGEMKSEVEHVQDSIINDVINYYPDGRTKMSEGRYIGVKGAEGFERIKEGEWKLYLKDGTLSAEENYHSGSLNGNCRYYFPNGKICKLVTYQNGLQEGPFMEYYEDGSKKSEGSYHLDEFEGEYSTYFPGGVQETRGHYVKGIKDGLWIFFKTSGRVEMTVKYKLGEEVGRYYDNGTFMEYYPNGIPKSEYTYEDGKKNGPFTEWYDKGEFVKVPTTQDEMNQGIMFREKLQNTQKKMEGDYLDDHFEGEITWYNEDGRVLKKETWEDGKLVSSGN